MCDMSEDIVHLSEADRHGQGLDSCDHATVVCCSGPCDI